MRGPRDGNRPTKEMTRSVQDGPSRQVVEEREDRGPRSVPREGVSRPDPIVVSSYNSPWCHHVIGNTQEMRDKFGNMYQVNNFKV